MTAVDDRRRRPRPLLEAALVLLAATAAAVVVTWPLAIHLDTMVADPADGPFQAWTIDHVQWALTGGGPLWDANIFAPNRNTLAYSDSLLGLAVPLLPLRWLGLNPIAQLNVALLAGMATSAAAAYLFAMVATGRRAVAAVAAAAFAFGPFGTASATHVHAAFHAGVAVAAAAAWWLADRARDDRPVAAPAAVLAASLVWQASVSFYPGAYAAMAAVLVLALRFRDLGRRGRLAAAAGLGAAALGLGLLALPYLAVLREGREFVRSAEEIADLGVDLARVDPRLTIWGGVLGDGTPVGLRAFPGVTLLALGVAGLFARQQPRVRLAGIAFVALGLFLAFGTSDTGWRAWSPYRLLFEHVPGFTVIRATGRAWVLGVLGLGLLAGLGCVRLGRRSAAATAVLAAVAVVGVVAEGHSSWSDRPTMTVSAADEALADIDEEGGVLYLPALVPDGPLAVPTTFGQAANVYGTTAHHRITPNGYSGLAPEEWPALSKRMLEIPEPATLRELREIGVRFVVVRRWAAPTPWGPLLEPANAEPLELVGRYDGDVVYRLPPP